MCMHKIDRGSYSLFQKGRLAAKLSNELLLVSFVKELRYAELKVDILIFRWTLKCHDQ